MEVCLEYDPDDPVPTENQFWGFWNRFAEDWMRFARFVGILALLTPLCLPQPAKAQNARPAGGYGMVCDTPDQVRRFVLSDDPATTLAAINKEKAQSCSLMKVSFYVGKVDGTIVGKDGVWEITHILIVGIVDHGGIAAVEPTPQWIAIAVPSEAV
jgi:hypothetical protein